MTTLVTTAMSVVARGNTLALSSTPVDCIGVIYNDNQVVTETVEVTRTNWITIPVGHVNFCEVYSGGGGGGGSADASGVLEKGSDAGDSTITYLDETYTIGGGKGGETGYWINPSTWYSGQYGNGGLFPNWVNGEHIEVLATLTGKSGTITEQFIPQLGGVSNYMGTQFPGAAKGGDGSIGGAVNQGGGGGGGSGAGMKIKILNNTPQDNILEVVTGKAGRGWWHGARYGHDGGGSVLINTQFRVY